MFALTGAQRLSENFVPTTLEPVVRSNTVHARANVSAANTTTMVAQKVTTVVKRHGRERYEISA